MEHTNKAATYRGATAVRMYAGRQRADLAVDLLTQSTPTEKGSVVASGARAPRSPTYPDPPALPLSLPNRLKRQSPPMRA